VIGMELIRDFDQYKIYIQQNDKKLIEFGFVGDEFVIIFYTDQMVPISRSVDPEFYDSYQKLLLNSYELSPSFSHQEEGRIVWFSDGYCDLGDKWQTDVKSRLCIEQREDQLVFSSINPFFDQYPYQNNPRVIILSPAGNGHYSRNRDTNMTLQDDVIAIHGNLLQKNKRLEKFRDITI